MDKKRKSVAQRRDRRRICDLFFVTKRGQYVDPIKPRRVPLKERKDTNGSDISSIELLTLH